MPFIFSSLHKFAELCVELSRHKRHNIDRSGNINIVVEDHVVPHRADRASTRRDAGAVSSHRAIRDANESPISFNAGAILGSDCVEELQLSTTVSQETNSISARDTVAYSGRVATEMLNADVITFETGTLDRCAVAIRVEFHV